MSYDHFLEDQAYLAAMDDEIRADYPKYVDRARNIMNRILHRKDKYMWRVFNGRTYDNRMIMGDLVTTHRYISSLLKSRDEGQPVTDLYLESTVHACLGLGFVVIEGGRKD